jgi:hypothetical protein
MRWHLWPALASKKAITHEDRITMHRPQDHDIRGLERKIPSEKMEKHNANAPQVTRLAIDTLENLRGCVQQCACHCMACRLARRALNEAEV